MDATECEMEAITTFTPGTPTVVAIEARRHLRAGDAPRGKLFTYVENKLSFSEDRKHLNVELTARVEGKSESGDETAFSAECVVECSFTFSEPAPDATMTTDEFMALFGGPLFQRAALQLQDIAWRMGYTAIRVPLYLGANNIAVEEIPVANGPTSTEKPRKARRSRKPADQVSRDPED